MSTQTVLAILFLGEFPSLLLSAPSTKADIITTVSAECLNYAECIEHDIDSSYIDCSSDMSCQESKINCANSFDGYIQCNGDAACKRGALSSNNIINCFGHESCYFSDYLIATNDIICSGDHSCFSNNYVSNNPHLQSDTANILCQGSGSCLDATIQSQKSTFCVAFESCSSTNINSGITYKYVYKQ